MQITTKIYNNYQQIRNIMIGLIVILSLVAMFSAPSVSVRGPSPTPITTEPAHIIVFFFGLAIGCYGTIIGIGGGPLIVPVLVLFYGWESEILVATSLFIVFLNATSGSIGYAVQKRIDYKGGMKFALAALPGAVISGFVHHTFTIKTFDIIFGVFLLLLAAYSFLSKNRVKDDYQKVNKKNNASDRRVTFIDNFGHKFNFYSNDKLGVSMNLVLGFFVGFLGIGGGVCQ